MDAVQGLTFYFSSSEGRRSGDGCGGGEVERYRLGFGGGAFIVTTAAAAAATE